MYSEINNTDYQNDWAKDIKGDAIHIKNAKSGLQGYYCLGCDKEMQAVKFKNPKYNSYFRHNASNLDKDHTECVVASKVYRERLAEQILHRLKEIKVPTVYKFPPKGIEGVPNLLQKSQVIKAFKVKSQLSFYEDAEGEINWGKNVDIRNRYLLIRPDITFFNENDEPILFIEFVVTHKLPPEKKVKLLRLGIDTVQIIIPKLPEREIEKSLKSVRKFKWVYNGLEADTEYVQISKGNTERVPSIDEDQRRFFEESFKCRTAQISNLIRTINKCLRSESYRRAERQFESEISRIAEAAERETEGLDEMERRIDSEVQNAIAGEIQGFEHEEEAFEGERNEFQNYVKSLEERYFRKAGEIEEKQRAIDKEQETITELTEEAVEYNKTEEEIRAEFKEQEQIIELELRERTGTITENIEAEEAHIEELRKEEESLPESFEQLRGEATESFEKSKSKLRREEEGLSGYYKRLRDDAEGRYEIENKRIREEESNLKDTVREEFHKALKGNPSKLSRGIKNILEAQRVGRDFEIAKRQEERYRAARKLFNKGTWKTW